MTSLQFAIPESQGLSSARLAEYVRENFSAARPYSHSLIIMRNGKIVSETYRKLCSPADRHQLFSLSKSFVSTAIGIAIGEGLISLDDKIVKFFPEYLSDKVGERMRSATIRDCLTMRSGRDTCGLFGNQYRELGDGRHFANNRPWMQNLLEEELVYDPGTVFFYDSSATYTLSAILHRAAGQGLLDYLRPRFFEPIGIGPDIIWDRDPEGIECGGWGLNLSTREIALAAQVWLNYGKTRDGKILVPEDYMRLALSKQADNSMRAEKDWKSGYGFQFWVCHNGFVRGDGANGQFAVMSPELDIAVIGTSGICDMQGQFDIMWNKLLPAVQDAPLPENEAALADLRNAEREFEFDFGPVGAPQKAFKSVAFEVGENPFRIKTVSVVQDGGGLAVDLGFANGAVDRIEAGYTEPRPCSLRYVYDNHLFAAWGRAHWKNETTAEIRLAIPCGTSFLTFTLGTASCTFRTCSEIFFARPDLQDVTLVKMHAE
jgi:CubicO group peptidase (beta-lactamase class C family)